MRALASSCSTSTGISSDAVYWNQTAVADQLLRRLRERLALLLGEDRRELGESRAFTASAHASSAARRAGRSRFQVG